MVTALKKTAEFGACRITVDEATKIIFLQEDWRYNWRVKGLDDLGNLARKLYFGTDPSIFDMPSPWTLAEKQTFHNKCDTMIWRHMSGNVKIFVTGQSNFACRNIDSVFSVNFDIRWVLTGGHWQVDVLKVPAYARAKESEHVHFPDKKIQLVHGVATIPRRLNESQPKAAMQASVLHEFGHTFDVDDEYGYEYGRDQQQLPSAFVKDINGLMNIGNQLRNRYFKEVIVWMNTMIPDTKFEIDYVY